MEYQSIGIGHVFLYFLVNTVGCHHRGIWSVIAYGLASGYNIRWNILGESGSGLNHSAVADTCLGVFYHRRGEDYAIANGAIAGYLGTITEEIGRASCRERV